MHEEGGSMGYVGYFEPGSYYASVSLRSDKASLENVSYALLVAELED